MNSSCRSMHGAAIFKGGAILSVGYNKSRLQNSYANWWEEGPVPSEHAESSAIRQCKNQGIDMTGAILYVSRINKAGKEMFSMPCPKCRAEIKQAGIKRVCYTIDSSYEVE